jgi:stage V sporulation protein G
MEITEVRVFPVDEEKLKAFASIIFDDCFVVSDIKVIHGTQGLFISMPSKKRKNGTFRDIAHPLNNETRRKIEERVLARYWEMVDGGASESIGAAASSAPRAVAPPAEDDPPLTESTRDIFGP